MSLEVADRGEQARSQFRGAIVEALTERLLAARTGPVRRERRILFDGRPAEIHPYDVTVERDGAAEAWDCKWGARGIKADVLHQLDDARRGAADEGGRLLVGLVVFDARRSCEVRLVRERGPVALDGAEADRPRGPGPAGRPEARMSGEAGIDGEARMTGEAGMNGRPETGTRTGPSSRA